MSSTNVALVTGASAGIGKTIVHHLLRDGWTVYGAARRIAKMDDIAEAGARVLELDVTDEASMQACVDAILEAEGRIDVLVNNAGYGSYGALEEVPIDEAKRQFDVNVFGLMRMSQLVIPSMRERGSGRIVNISSMGGRIWMPTGGWYHATKHAVEVLSDTLRVEVERFGIDVVIIQPGAIESEWAGVAAETLEATSEDSHYPDLVEAMSGILRSYTSASPPSIVAAAVSRAANSTKPMRRYSTGLDAKLLLFVYGWMPTWLWDRLVVRAMKWM